MSKFFDKFPTLTYQVDSSLVLQTNIMFRIKIINDFMKRNIYSYLPYFVPDGETIEATAEKYYGDPEAHWIIILANNFTNPLYDWPLIYEDFNNYLIGKYGSVANAETQIHHYELITNYTSGQPPIENIITTIIDEDTYNSTPTYSFQAINFANTAYTVDEIKTTRIVYAWDYENDLNEAKRTIKIIKNDYLGQIQAEFQALTESNGITKPFIRSLKNF